MKWRIMIILHDRRQWTSMQPEIKNTTRSKTKSPTAAKGTSQAIAEHTNAFLKAGGKIIKIRSGTRDQETATEK